MATKTETPEVKIETPETPKANAPEVKEVKPHYEEWRVEVHNSEVEKIKMLRPKVKITEETAENLNNGVLGQKNVNYGLMYFLPESEAVVNPQ